MPSINETVPVQAHPDVAWRAVNTLPGEGLSAWRACENVTIERVEENLNIKVENFGGIVAVRREFSDAERKMIYDITDAPQNLRGWFGVEVAACGEDGESQMKFSGDFSCSLLLKGAYLARRRQVTASLHQTSERITTSATERQQPAIEAA